MKKHISNKFQDAGRIGPENVYYNVIHDAYRIIRYPTPEDAQVCECCFSSKTRKSFGQEGQRALSFEHLQEWFHAAPEKELLTSTWGFILPRVFEALAAGCEPNSCGVEVSLDKFPMGNPKRWKPREWEVIDCFQKIYLKNRSPSGDVTLDEALCMFACAGWIG